MGKLPSDLEEIWKAKHFEDAEKAFTDVANGAKVESGPSFFQKAEIEDEVKA